jgi:hypothetical protein
MPKRVFLQPHDLVKKSRHHTSYAGDGAVNEGRPGPLYKMEFFNGIARDVDEQTYKRFEDLGHCDTARPKLAGDDDDY